MNRQECIEEIRKYILSSKITRIYNADFNIDKNKEEQGFPSLEEIYNYINNASNSDKFFHNLTTTLNKYKEYAQGSKIKRVNVSSAPLLKRIDMSEATIKKMLDIFPFAIKFSKFPETKIHLNISTQFLNENTDSLYFLYESLLKLSDKVQKYIKINAIYSNAYYVEYESKINFKKENAQKIINGTNDKIQKIIEKKYIPDFLSDGSDDIKEMMKLFWEGIDVLLYFTKPKETIYYSVNNDKVINIKEYFLGLLNTHYKELDDYIFLDSIFDSFDNAILKSKYEALIKINVPKGVNPRTETDLAIKMTNSEKELEALIGLTKVKEMISKIKAYAEANKDSEDLNIHMCFRGNPGTGKTEVAKILGKLLYEIGILPKKNFISATRKDLVGQYIGETAQKTSNLIDDAMGGVLFIDEAYSLATPGDSKDFGNEAIAELLTGMENNKGKFCVIFAGYTDKINEMISTNDGLASRIQFYIDFPDYNRDEISEIALKMLGDKYIIDELALNRILDIIDVFRQNPKFGNARVIKNVLDQCIMSQNQRRLDANDKVITLEDVENYAKFNDLKLPKATKHSEKILTGTEQLERLIGLREVKDKIKKIKAYAKTNLKSDDLSLHMAFIGNPGTGKSEVANIISRVLYESGITREAKCIKAKRDDLIGSHVGETAQKTRNKIKEAMGGVLFIDEAYSLGNDVGNSQGYGDECIQTLVDAMEEHKGDFVVIMAGYENELLRMISSNIGLKDRFQFIIHFEDYSPEELKEIISLFLKKEGKYTITDEALNEIVSLCEYYRYENKEEFANARTARKILREVIMNQNVRLEDKDNDFIIRIEDVNRYAKDVGLVKRSEIKEKKVKSILGEKFIKYLEDQSSKVANKSFSYQYLEQSVVSISCEDGGQGTAFIISSDGYVLTCDHCLNKKGLRQKIRIVLPLADGQKITNYLDFDIVYVNELNDFALLKLENYQMKFKYLPICDINKIKYDSLRSFLMAGFPFGGESFDKISLTEGKIASVNMYRGRKVVFADMFGKPGSSGSPIIDKETNTVIGIYWGGITDPLRKEMIHCFTPFNVILQYLIKGNVN